MQNPIIYPWQKKQWDRLQQSIEQKRFAHALLMSGAKGIGKTSLATELAKKLLCNTITDEEACGHCNACLLFSSNTHPDYHLIKPEQEGKAIKVDQIRQMVENNSLTPHISAVKIYLLLEADKMNTAAANSLLKTLEEPTPNSIIILVTHKPERLSATVRSRCQQYSFRTPEHSEAINWLNTQTLTSDPESLLSLTQGAPLDALLLDSSDLLTLHQTVFVDFGRIIFGKEDPVKIASEWQKYDAKMILKWMTIWVIDLIRLKYNQSEPIHINNRSNLPGLLKIASVFNKEQLFINYQQQLKASYLIDTQVNQLLLLETLLIPWIAVQ